MKVRLQVAPATRNSPLSSLLSLSLQVGLLKWAKTTKLFRPRPPRPPCSVRKHCHPHLLGVHASAAFMPRALQNPHLRTRNFPCHPPCTTRALLASAAASHTRKTSLALVSPAAPPSLGTRPAVVLCVCPAVVRPCPAHLEPRPPYARASP
jgi:hypothetical protein